MIAPKYHLTVSEGMDISFSGLEELFLDRWSLPLSKPYKHAKVVESYINDNNEQDKYHDFQEMEVIVRNKLCGALNDIHGIKYSQKFWDIVLGHWVRFFVGYIYNRYETVQHCLNNYNIRSVGLIEVDKETLIPQDYPDFTKILNKKSFNIFVLIRIFKFLNAEELIKYGENLGDSLIVENSSYQQKLTSYIKSFLSGISFVLSKLNRDNAAVIVDSRLGRIDEVLLQVLLGQFPILHLSTKKYLDKTVDFRLRKVCRRNGFLITT